MVVGKIVVVRVREMGKFMFTSVPALNNGLVRNLKNPISSHGNGRTDFHIRQSWQNIPNLLFEGLTSK